MTLGLTGGMGSGKSIVAKLFELLGCAIFDSDNVARLCYFDPEVKLAVVQLLGEEAYNNDLSLNKDFIANIIFKEAEKREALNKIVHPAVKKRMLDFEANNAQRTIIKESALLFETGIAKEIDKIIVVTAPDDLRIKRIIKRDRLTEQQVIHRLSSQMSQDAKAANAHFVIRNDEKTLLIPQVLKIYEQIKN